MVEIRRATLKDLDTLLHWRITVIRDVFRLPEDYDTGLLEKENLAYYQNALSDGGHIACFALLDGNVVGCGGICFQTEMPSPDNPSGQCAYLMNVYTEPSSRRKGIGRAVVGWLIQRAKEKGAGKIYLEATEAGAGLYSGLGFRRAAGFMKLKQDSR